MRGLTTVNAFILIALVLLSVTLQAFSSPLVYSVQQVQLNEASDGCCGLAYIIVYGCVKEANEICKDLGFC